MPPESPPQGAKKKKKAKLPKQKSGIESRRNETWLKRRRHAEQILETAIGNKTNIISCDDITRILEDYCREYDLPLDRFDCLEKLDRCELVLELKNHTSPGPTREDLESASPHTALLHGQPTPKSSCDGQAAQVCEDTGSEDEDRDNASIAPINEALFFDTILCIGSQTELAVGCEYECHRSYVLEKIVKRCRLKEDKKVKNTVLITWRRTTSKDCYLTTTRSRFWIAKEGFIKHDIAFGTDCDEVEDEDDISSDNRGDSGQVDHGDEDDDETDDDDQEDDVTSISVPVVQLARRDPHAVAETSSETDEHSDDEGIMTKDGKKLVGDILLYIGSKAGKSSKRTHSESANEHGRSITLTVEKTKVESQKAPRIVGGRHSPGPPYGTTKEKNGRKAESSQVESLKDQKTSKTKIRKK